MKFRRCPSNPVHPYHMGGIRFTFDWRSNEWKVTHVFMCYWFWVVLVVWLVVFTLTSRTDNTAFVTHPNGWRSLVYLLHKRHKNCTTQMFVRQILGSKVAVLPFQLLLLMLFSFYLITIYLFSYTSKHTFPVPNTLSVAHPSQTHTNVTFLTVHSVSPIISIFTPVCNSNS